MNEKLINEKVMSVKTNYLSYYLKKFFGYFYSDVILLLGLTYFSLPFYEYRGLGATRTIVLIICITLVLVRLAKRQIRESMLLFEDRRILLLLIAIILVLKMIRLRPMERLYVADFYMVITSIFWQMKKLRNKILFNEKTKGFIFPLLDEMYKVLDQREANFDTEVENKLKSERLRTELITNVSHDIRTPLTSIISFCNLLSKEELNDTSREYLRVIDKSANRMKDMVSNLFEASKSYMGNKDIKIETVNFSELLMQVYAPLDNEFNKNHIQMIYETSEENILVYADGKYLSRVIENLLTNVLKYAVPYTRLYISADLEDSRNDLGMHLLNISFKNVSEERLDMNPEELMEQFVRGDKSRNTEGSGLGLFIAQNLVRQMKGSLKIEMEDDIFKAIILLPAAREEIITKEEIFKREELRTHENI